MELFIQMGHGMKSMSLELLGYWGKGTVILSPMNILPKSIIGVAEQIHQKNGDVLIDPQLYFPRKYHKKLSNYSYWPQEDITLLEAGSFNNVIAPLAQLNRDASAISFILPSFTTSKIDARWDSLQKTIIDSGIKYASDLELFHTISLSSSIMLDEAQIEKIISYSEKWAVNGLYIVCEHPSNYYLVDNPVWVTNLLALVAGLKRLHKKVVVGYANHQMLCLATAKCDAIASGNFLNVRWFQPEHFETIENDEISRRAKWYYCPQALSEFKVPFLDIAKRMGLLDVLQASGKMENPYSKVLFGGATPSSTGYGEKESHRHYLWCLREQCQSAVRSTYKETLDAQTATLETAEQLLSVLHSKRIKGQDRDFSEIIDVNQVALAAHDMAYQFSLGQEWVNL